MSDIPVDGPVYYGEYVVALIDLLGQSNKLQELDKLSLGPPDKQEITRKLRDTAGAVHEVRVLLEDNVRAFCSVTPETLPGYAHLSDARKAEAQRLFTTDVKCWHFSDTTVASRNFTSVRVKSH
jgi:hypothetical protein